MEHHPVQRIEGESSLQVEGFPDAERLIQIDDPKARRISDLLLHQYDLEFADECLNAINVAPSDPSAVKEALWRSAIVHFSKCFGSSAARFQLSRENIYKNEPPEAKLVFEYFKNLRDKHVVHDENSYSQSIPGAVLNRRDGARKIETIICFMARASTLEQTNYNNLKLLIKKALVWVVAEFNACCEGVAAELEALPYDELQRLPNMTYRVPDVGEISENRKKNKRES